MPVASYQCSSACTIDPLASFTCAIPFRFLHFPFPYAFCNRGSSRIPLPVANVSGFSIFPIISKCMNDTPLCHLRQSQCYRVRLDFWVFVSTGVRRSIPSPAITRPASPISRSSGRIGNFVRLPGAGSGGAGWGSAPADPLQKGAGLCKGLPGLRASFHSLEHAFEGPNRVLQFSSEHLRPAFGHGDHDSDCLEGGR